MQWAAGRGRMGAGEGVGVKWVHFLRGLGRGCEFLLSGVLASVFQNETVNPCDGS